MASIVITPAGGASITVPGTVLMDTVSGLPVTPSSSAVRAVTALTIANAASVSDVLDLDRTALLGFIAPAAWTAAALNIEVSTDNSTWASAVLGSSNAAVGSWSAVVASNAYSVDMVALLPFRYVRLRSGTFAVPVAQGAARVFNVVTRPLA